MLEHNIFYKGKWYLSGEKDPRPAKERDKRQIGAMWYFKGEKDPRPAKERDKK